MHEQTLNSRPTKKTHTQLQPTMCMWMNSVLMMFVWTFFVTVCTGAILSIPQLHNSFASSYEISLLRINARIHAVNSHQFKLVTNCHNSHVCMRFYFALLCFDVNLSCSHWCCSLRHSYTNRFEPKLTKVTSAAQYTHRLSTNQHCALGVVATSKAVERWKFIAVFNLCAALEEISRVLFKSF